MHTEIVQIALFTTLAALAATVVMLPPGIALAWVLARHRFRGKSVVETVASLPLVMPPVATGLLLLWLVGRRGPIGKMLAPFGIEIVFTLNLASVSSAAGHHVVVIWCVFVIDRLARSRAPRPRELTIGVALDLFRLRSALLVAPRGQRSDTGLVTTWRATLSLLRSLTLRSHGAPLRIRSHTRRAARAGAALTRRDRSS